MVSYSEMFRLAPCHYSKQGQMKNTTLCSLPKLNLPWILTLEAFLLEFFVLVFFPNQNRFCGRQSNGPPDVHALIPETCVCLHSKRHFTNMIKDLDVERLSWIIPGV